MAGERVFTSFSALGEALGFDDPARPVEVDDMYNLPVVKQLECALDAKFQNRFQASALRNTALHSALEMDPEERKANNIRVLAFVPFDHNGGLPERETLSYPLFATFDYRGNPRYLSGSRLTLHDLYKDPGESYQPDSAQKVDELVKGGAELFPESIGQRYFRLVHEIKLTDSLLKREKLAEFPKELNHGRAYRVQDVVDGRSGSARVEDLNNLKTERMLAYLQTCERILEECPQLMTLYSIEDEYGDGLHATIRMRYLSDANHAKRIHNPDACIKSKLRVSNEWARSNVNVDQLRVKRDRLAHDPSSEVFRTAASLYECIYPKSA